MMRLFLLFTLFGLARFAFAEVRPFLPDQQTATIFFRSELEKAVTPARSAQWKEFCERFAKHLSIQNVPSGFLARSTCQTLDTPPSVVANKSTDPFWRIQIIERKRFFDIEVSILSDKGSYQILRAHSFKMEEDLLENLKGEIVPEAMARMLVESLPTGWVYIHQSSKATLSLTQTNEVPGIPPDMLIYDLSYDSETNKWLPKVRARMKVTDEKKLGKKRTSTFQVSQVYLPLVDNKAYWVQSARGLNVRQSEYEKVLGKNMQGVSLLNFLDKLLFDSFESNYGGFRYGKSFLSGTSIVTEADLFSMLIEMRSGLFNGLRFYYDMSPEEKKGSGDTLEFFSMSRASLGWAFDFELPGFMQFLVSRVEVQPKFGLLDLKTHFKVLDETGTEQSLSFDARNVYDLALELGIEKQTYWLRSRLWGSFSAAAFGISNQSNVSVFSTKAGLDTYYDLVNYGSWDINLLAFVIAERLNLGKNDKKLDENQDLGISEVTFNLFFVGGGFTISW